MSLSLLVPFLLAVAIATAGVFVFWVVSKGSQRVQADLAARLRSSSRRASQALRSPAGTLIVTGLVFLLVAGIGTATTYVRPPHHAAATAAADDDGLARLEDYVRSGGPEGPVSVAADNELLPDVNTMIERLAARLEGAPNDAQGWRMLGWSYFNTGHYEKAAGAYAKAVELEPGSAELKRAHEEAKAKASESGARDPAPSAVTGAAAPGGDGLGREAAVRTGAAPLHDSDATVRSMVDRLGDRLESSPRDVEGWTRLMRSRVVLGEPEVAQTAFRKALDVFKDDSAASTAIMAAATELGLRAE